MGGSCKREATYVYLMADSRCMAETNQHCGLPCWLSWYRIHLQCRRPWLDSWVGKTPCRRDTLPTAVFLGFPGGSDNEESAFNGGDLGLIPGLGRSPGEGKGYPLQYSCLENLHGQRSLVGYSPWGCKELDMTEQLSTAILYRNS